MHVICPTSNVVFLYTIGGQLAPIVASDDTLRAPNSVTCRSKS